MKILTVCPSIRPEQYNKMIDSFYGTISEDNTLFTTQVAGVTNSINDAFKRYPDFDFYHVTNDDAVYKTKGWDNLLPKKGKITHGTDKVDIGDNGNFLMIDGDIVRAVGWLQMPLLNKYCGDTAWKYMGQQLDILEYIPEVIIEHNWEGAIKEDNEADMNKWAEWLPVAFKDINKIKEILNDKHNLNY